MFISSYYINSHDSYVRIKGNGDVIIFGTVLYEGWTHIYCCNKYGHGDQNITKRENNQEKPGIQRLQ